ncbi:quinone oxidoreductase 10 [Heterobasidion irregulare TC 32-1]|uniref:Quinone oxidoreductase 10 n=1 Tax=Heterobasidion irregulare (strain TC 32-1) TaxID=747525 RepID=W4KHD9_HETIT|nr:quinone oxidoreductase 10 [Heterobasidion irregulare TC 32-1]ETW85134.1 quinone oxidoreductase 10 [Heterobasidion irregulare TC 32-1]
MSQQTVFRLKEALGPSGYVKLRESVPSPKAHEVLVRIHAASLNFRDYAVSKGLYPFPIKADVVPGSDMAGEVVSVGEGVAGFKVGDRVSANFDPTHFFGPQPNWKGGLGAPIDGVLQEYRAFDEHGLLHIPKHLTWEEAACIPCAGVTAWNALYGGIPLIAGQTVLLQGTGGVSMFGLILAHAAGAKTIITSSSDEKLEIAKKLGATHTINYKKQPNWDEVALELTDGEGVHHIFDNVGAREIERCFNCVAAGGTISSIGFLGGQPTTSPNVPGLALAKGAILRGINVGSKQLHSDLLRFVATKQLRPYIDKVFPLDQFPEAVEYLSRGEHIGKIVIRVSSP